jgi:two-component system sensor histidine kinase SenX3
MLISNLVDNAVKYSQEGGEVCIRAEAGPHQVRLSVSDCGIGISTENQQHVFEEFFRVKDGTVRTSGTGMGLPICKKIAEELGGEICLTSEPGQGSTFTVVLPRVETRSGSADEPADEPPLGCA